jgi:hypothetical protein
MSKGKSFIMHLDSLDILDDLTLEECGEFIKAIKFYHENEGLPQTKTIIKIALKPLINQFTRDQEKYDKLAKRNRINGSKGGRPKKEEKPSGFSGNPEEPTESLNKNKSKNKSKNKNDNKIINNFILFNEEERIKERIM